MTRWLPANFVTGPIASPASTSFSGFVRSAERNTSAGAPCSICVRRAADESRATVKANAGVARLVGGLDGFERSRERGGQRTQRAQLRRETATDSPRVRYTRQPRPRREAATSDPCVHGRASRGSRDDGTSTTTFVALTMQIASSPTWSPSSRAPSAVMRLTMRCGPGKDLDDGGDTIDLDPRDDPLEPVAGRSRDGRPIRRQRGGARQGAGSPRRSGTRRWPPADRTVVSRPSASQRRTVSTVTPSISAACPIRRT